MTAESDKPHHVDADGEKRSRGRPRLTAEEIANRADLKKKADEIASKAREAAFRTARDRLRREIKAHTLFARDLYPFFSKEWVRDMCLGEEQYPDPKPIHQDRLIWFFEKHSRRTLYETVAGLIKQHPSEQLHILDRYAGEYRYFRYAAVGRHEAKYVTGRFRIWDDQGRPVFGHWSHDYEKEKPEHEGYVFRLDSNLFFAGYGSGVLRLSIARTVFDSVAESHMPGLVVSMRNGTRDPFAARFLLVHEDNAKQIAELDPKNGGREVFEQLAMHNDELHYMLVDLRDD